MCDLVSDSLSTVCYYSRRKDHVWYILNVAIRLQSVWLRTDYTLTARTSFDQNKRFSNDWLWECQLEGKD